MTYSPYYPIPWEDGLYDANGVLIRRSATPVTADALTHIEAGIAAGGGGDGTWGLYGGGTPSSGQVLSWNGTAYVPTTSSSKYTVTATKTAAYTVNAGEYVPVDTSSAAVVLTLPSSPPDGTSLGWKLTTAGNALTVACSGTDVFTKPGSGVTSVSATLPGQGALAQYNATNHVWLILADDLPLAQLDARYTAAGTAASWNLYAGGAPSPGQVPAWNGTAYVPTTVSGGGGGTVSDATTTSRGVVQLAGALGGTAAAPTVPGLTRLAYDVKAYGALGDGTTDDTAAINSAIAAALAAPGGRVWFPSGIYATSSSIEIPENVTIEGVHGDTIPYATSPTSPCVIRPLSSHTGTAILRLRGKDETARTYDHVGARIRNLTLDGTNTPAGTKGIQVAGLVREARFEYVTVNAAKDTSFWFGAGTTDTSKFPQSLRLVGCLAKASGNNGYTFVNVPDSTIVDCNSLGATNSGFSIQGFMNGQIANCRAEWSGQSGILFTSGYWASGQGSGGCIVSSITTDRNGYNGIYVDATGAGALQFTGVVNRRDGRNAGAGAGGYAGFSVAATATMPVIVDNLQVYPGVDDDHNDTNGPGGTPVVTSPQYGVYAPGANPVTITSGYVFAATTAIFGGSGLVVSPMVGSATGVTAAPVRSAPTLTAGHSGLYPIAEYGLSAATVHPDVCVGSATAQTVSRLGLYRLWIPANVPINGLVAYVTTVAQTAGSGTVNRYAVYTDAGVLAASTADTPALFTTLGAQAAALSAPVAAQTAGRFVYVGLVHQFTGTNPKFQCVATPPAASYAWKISNGAVTTTGNYRVQAIAGVTTTLPASFTPAAGNVDVPMPFIGVY
jgi:hypothetical protein